eukprot:m.241669 g.241669  ORF g.241669 m.241669 type:complete len:146 (-) comp25152_c0_seq1:214-651(-)
MDKSNGSSNNNSGSFLDTLKDAKARRKSQGGLYSAGDKELTGTNTWRRVKDYHSKVIDSNAEDDALTNNSSSNISSTNGSKASLLDKAELETPFSQARERSSSVEMSTNNLLTTTTNERRGSAVLENGYTSADIDNLFSFASSSK